MHELPNGSATTGHLPKGCVQCEKGAKMVLLITGQCSCDCFYCPLSEAKQGRPDAYANERQISSPDDILAEAESISAEGTGITGGDPLIPIERTLAWIRLLKEKFGNGHHIHLYTATPDIKKIKMLAEAGLDEIRFHPPPEVWPTFTKSKYPEAIEAANKYGLDVGLEIPVLPDVGSEMLALLKSAEMSGARFVNLNELEFSDTNWRELKERGYEIKNDVESSAKGSEELAIRILREWEHDGGKMPLHYCSASFKDGIQLRRRIMRRAENTATELEVITHDGTFIIGIVETDEPDALMANIMEAFEVPPELVRVDGGRGRVEIAAWVLEEIFEELDGACFIIEEYPTADRLEVERRPLIELALRPIPQPSGLRM